jgi:hypothetical protein
VAVFDGEPVLAYRDINGKRDNMSSAFQQVFNPSWIVASEGVHHAGLLVRTQNCSAAPGQCVRCSGSGQRASVLTFSRLASLDGAHDHPVFFPVDESSVVFAPHDETDDYGTEDPRVAYDAESGTYIMYYTCYNSGKTTQPTVTMCAAPPNTALAARDCLRTLLPLPLADAPLPLADPSLARVACVAGARRRAPTRRVQTCGHGTGRWGCQRVARAVPSSSARPRHSLAQHSLAHHSLAQHSLNPRLAHHRPDPSLAHHSLNPRLAQHSLAQHSLSPSVLPSICSTGARGSSTSAARLTSRTGRRACLSSPTQHGAIRMWRLARRRCASRPATTFYFTTHGAPASPPRQATSLRGPSSTATTRPRSWRALASRSSARSGTIG